ncbi:hypothetical protein Y032_0018g3485 [Ancylostoma ceylanicum]|uniref:Uncharacterized protein n=1 Tax=Ancylostoma ceylanicum TaxID=53326 RepID=A0A016V3W6_9BILA|nr:hypothetical protein Y032_0018g3485 [Ancylostoma ceylanicum]
MDFPFSACAVMAPNEKCDLEELVELENDIFVVYATFKQSYSFQQKVCLFVQYLPALNGAPALLAVAHP